MCSQPAALRNDRPDVVRAVRGVEIFVSGNDFPFDISFEFLVHGCNILETNRFCIGIFSVRPFPMAYIYSNWISHFVISNSRSQIAASNRLRTVGSFCRIRLRVFDPFGCFFGQCLFCRERRYDSFFRSGLRSRGGYSPAIRPPLCRHGTVRCGRPRFSLFEISVVAWQAC